MSYGLYSSCLFTKINFNENVIYYNDENDLIIKIKKLKKRQKIKQQNFKKLFKIY